MRDQQLNKMRTHKIVLLPGDGIGPEIISVAKELLSVVAQRHNFNLIQIEKPFGGHSIAQCGDPLSQDTLDSCKNSDAILLSAIGSPQYDNLPREKRPETGLLNLRSSLGLFANIRPVKIRRALIDESSLKPEFIRNVDLIVVRELISGIYFGEPKGRVNIGEEERAFNTMSYSSREIDKIAEIAFKLANSRKRKVCSVDKSNVLEVSQLWRDRVTLIAQRYKEVELSHLYVDNAAMQLVRCPSQFDVILTGNLFGDILSDESAMLSGSIGMLPSASISEMGPGLFEPVHGSAPDIAGTDKANPLAMVLSAAMMLRVGLNEEQAALDLEKAVDTVLDNGYRTSDLSGSEGVQEIGCKNMGQKLLEALPPSNYIKK